MAGAKTWISVKYYEVRQDLERPHWLKTPRVLLTDHGYLRLDDRGRALFHDLRILALDYRNRIPNDPEMLAKLRGQDQVIDLKPLLRANLITIQRCRSLASTTSADRLPSAWAAADKKEQKERKRTAKAGLED